MSVLKIDEASLKAFERRLQKAVLSDKPMNDALNLLEARAVELAPIATGNLEQSWVQQISRKARGMASEYGFGASYAAEVHELPPDRKGQRTRRKPAGRYGQAGPRFLLRAMRGTVGDGSLARTIADSYRRILGG